MGVAVLTAVGLGVSRVTVRMLPVGSGLNATVAVGETFAVSGCWMKFRYTSSNPANMSIPTKATIAHRALNADSLASG